MVTSSTRLIGIFGDPIDQTLSPTIQNAAISELGLDFIYLPFHITPEGLKNAIWAIRSLNMRGVNITIPHKEHVIDLIDEISDDAKNIGAVNTIVNEGGRLVGHNTDGAGYLNSLKLETGFDVAGKCVVLLGAGGAARGILSAILAKAPQAVVISNRNVERAERLATDFDSLAAQHGAEIHISAFEKPALMPYMEGADLVINSTSLGLSGKIPFNPLLLSLESVPKEAIVSDIVYKPLDTALLKSARRAGLKVHKGLGMLIHQGAIGFKLWTGEEAPINVMTRAALEALDI